MSVPRAFRSARGLGAAVVVLLAVNVAVLVLLGVFRALEMGLLRRAQRGELVAFSEATSSDDRIQAAAITWIVVLLVTGIVWLVWQHRSQANLRAVGRTGLTYTPGWAVGWWLIPFANFVLPFKTVRELWKASGPDPDWVRTATWPALGWWWAVWIVAAVVGRISASLINSANDVAEAISASRFALLTVAVTIVAAVLAIVVVRSIVARQGALATGGGEPAMPPPPPRPDVGDRGGAPGP